jgi:mRNA-degrading endonuclease YafQ of YafQ-DinJ toxin-antitoxin module
VAEVRVSEIAAARLERVIQTHSLPPDTRDRVRRSLRIAERFPYAGHELAGEWAGFRFILGPWRWLLVVYSYDQSKDVVDVVTIQDARSSQAVTTSL